MENQCGLAVKCQTHLDWMGIGWLGSKRLRKILPEPPTDYPLDNFSDLTQRS